MLTVTLYHVIYVCLC